MDANDKIVLRQILENVLVKDIMEVKVYPLKVEDPLSRAVELFSVHGVSHLPVVDDNQRLVGLLSHKYLYKTVSPRKFIEGELNPDPAMVMEKDSYYWKDMVNSFILRKVMYPNPPQLKPDDHLSKAVLTMAARYSGCIFVTNPSGQVVGALTDLDIVDYLAQSLLD